jgi:hypothetical protein
MPTFPRQPLRTALYERLTGDDGQGLGLSESVYVAGAVPTGQSAPYVVIERTRSRGGNFIGGRGRFRVRVAIRVHTRHAKGRVDQSEADDLAEAVHDSLTGADLSVTGYRSPTVLTPDVQPVAPYDIGEMRAYDLNCRYTFRFSN